MLPILTRRADRTAAAQGDTKRPLGDVGPVLRAFRDRPMPGQPDARGDDVRSQLRSPVSMRSSELDPVRPALSNYNVILDDVSYARDRKGRKPPIFRKASALLPVGRRIAVLGNKGAGKTTLANLISGVLTPDSGAVHVNRRVSWPFGFNRMLVPTTSFRSNMTFLAGLMNLNFERTLDFVSHFSGIPADSKRPMNEIEMVMRRDMAIGLSIAANNDCYIIDGNLPINSMIDWKLEFIQRFLLSKDLIFVTSKASQARMFCDVAGVIEDQRIRFYRDFDVAVAQMEASPSYGGPVTDPDEEDAFDDEAEFIV